MDCGEFRSLIEASYNGELGEEQILEYRKHVEECPSCRHEAFQFGLDREAARYADVGNIDEQGPNGEEIGPIYRIANSIIQYAIKNNAHGFMIDFSNSDVAVSYRIGDNWHENEFILPNDLSKDLLERFREMALMKPKLLSHSEEGHIPIRYKNVPYKLIVTLIRTGGQERIAAHFVEPDKGR